MSATDPTPEQIRERTAEIRQKWSPRERERRARLKRVIWLPPVIRELDLPGYLMGESDPN
jgi:hypothetical protein